MVSKFCCTFAAEIELSGWDILIFSLCVWPLNSSIFYRLLLLARTIKFVFCDSTVAVFFVHDVGESARGAARWAAPFFVSGEFSISSNTLFPMGTVRYYRCRNTYQVSLLKYKEHLIFYIKTDVFYISFDVFGGVKIFYFTPFWRGITTSPVVCFTFCGLPMRSFSPSASAKCPFRQISWQYHMM